MATEKRRANVLSAIARNLPRLDAVPIDDTKTAHIACYGPSLRDTFEELRGKSPIVSMSGATRFLHERGITPDYHVEMDPRVQVVNHFDPPVPGVTYLLASVVDPLYFDTLKDEKVVLWHVVSTNVNSDLEWLAGHDLGEWLVSTGSHVGLGAIQIGGFLGYRHFEIYGMDGSFSDDGVRHADVHHGKVQPDQHTWAAGGKTYKTNQIMANGVAETINTMRQYPIFCVFHGEGLTQALIREEGIPNACTSDEAWKAALVRRSAPVFYEASASSKDQIPTWSPWEAICFSNPDAAWVVELQAEYLEAEKRRRYAKYNTGSISVETGLLLRGLCEWKKPETIIEVGTFIGKSTMAMKAVTIYTCDRDNDCLPATDKIKTFPYQTSTQMFERLVAGGIKADLFFFDGRLTDEDVPLIQQLSKPDTIYAFDDYHPTIGGGKGMTNVGKLIAVLPKYGIVEPYKAFGDRTTLALMMPPRKS